MDRSFRRSDARWCRAPDNIRVRIPIDSGHESSVVDALRLRQIGRTGGGWFWSVDELEIER